MSQWTEPCTTVPDTLAATNFAWSIRNVPDAFSPVSTHAGARLHPIRAVSLIWVRDRETVLTTQLDQVDVAKMESGSLTISILNPLGCVPDSDFEQTQLGSPEWVGRVTLRDRQTEDIAAHC